jgi:O-antigen/teichoic acid export membrane protein
MLSENRSDLPAIAPARLGLGFGLLTERSRQVWSLLRRESFDASTPEGRSKERYRRILISTITSVVARLVGIAVTLISVPLTIGYLGVERYGMWMTISSVIALLSFADLGIGNGLVTSLANADGNNDRRAAKTYVSSAFFLLTGISLALGGSFALAYPWVPWSRVLNITTPAAIAEAGPALAVFAACFLMNLPLGIVQRIQMGYQQGFTANLWQAFGALLSLVALLVAIYFEAGLPWLVLASVGAPLIGTAFNGLQIFWRSYRWLIPNWSCFDAASGKAVMKTGLLFFVLQVAGGVAFLSDNIVIAHILGQEAVAQYAVPAKLFALAPTILSMVLNPLWPAYGEAKARGDLAWIKRTLYRSLLLGFLVNGPIAVALTAFGKPVVSAWAGPEVAPTFLLLASLGVWTLIVAVTGPLAMFLNGIGVVRFQVACALAMAVTNILLSILFTSQVGVSGVVLGSIVSTTACIVVPTLVYLPRFFRAMNARRDT